jgi:pilus assembly protein CpaE
MSTKQPILLVTNDPETAPAVNAALESNGHFVADGVCADLRELVACLERAPTTGALVDIDDQPVDMLGELDPIITRFVETRFIVLSKDYDNELVLEAMQIGARHFLLKRSIASELSGALRRLIPTGSVKGERRGSVITVLGASGGCGATTVAINLANELHAVSSEPTLVIDLDHCYGAVRTYLGLDGQYGIADVLADAKRIDAQLVKSSALAYSDGLEALISPASTKISEPKPIQATNLGPALDACKRAYRFTVVDAPRVPSSVAVSLAHASYLTLIVFQLNVTDIRIVRDLLTVLSERGVSPERIMPLVNRYRRRHSMISLSEAETAVGSSALAVVRNDFRSVSRGINFGQPLAQAAPRSRTRRDLNQLAAKVLEGQASHKRITA